MTGLEIALFVLGLALVIISFFIVDSHDKHYSSAGDQKAQIDPAQLASIKEGILSDITRESAGVVQDAEDKLESLSNDKIMAVGEYSDQVLQKIDTNHNEVVFLYQMLKEKEDDLKAMMQRIDNVKVECEKLIRESGTIPLTGLETLTANAERRAASRADIRIPAETITAKPVVKPEAERPVVRQTAAPAQEPVRKPAPKKQAPGPTPRRQQPTRDMGETDTAMLGRNEEIIALYKSHKSVMEISKLLGMGQGEVRLIIELYCK